MSLDDAQRKILAKTGVQPNSDTRVALDEITSMAARDPALKIYLKEYATLSGIPAPLAAKAELNSLALCYLRPNYLKAWRGRVNPAWDLLETSGNEEVPQSTQAPQAPMPTSPAVGNAGGNANGDSAAALKALYAQIETAVTKLIEAKAASATIKLDPGAKEQIRDIVRRSTDERLAELAKPRVIEIHDTASGMRKSIGLQHSCFPTLLRACQAKGAEGNRMNIWLTGPTGSGKTTAGRNVSKALGLPFGCDGSLDADYKVLGFRDANGHIVSTEFLRIYEHGGIYIADEIDNWLPSALLSLNAALANGFVTTPGGMISRHPDCIVIACANTWGLGATNEYVGRNKLDAASLDRFHPKIHWPVDEMLEGAIAEAEAGKAGELWHLMVVKMRQQAKTYGLKIIVSPRATFSGIALLKAGFTLRETADMTVLSGLASDQVAKLISGLNFDLNPFAGDNVVTTTESCTVDAEDDADLLENVA